MKKRLLVVLMAACMMATAVSGCGKKDATAGESVESSVEDSKEESETPSSEAEVAESLVEAEVSTEEAVDDSVEEAVEENPEETTEESTTDSVEASAENDADETAEVSEEVADVVNADGKDWSTAYDDYFQRDDIMGENILCNASTTADGITFEVNVAAANGNMWMGYEFPNASFDMYADADKVYACTVLGGEETWIWAPITSDDDVDSITEMADTTMVDTESIVSCTYREAIEDDGVIYDILDVELDDVGTTGTVMYFINRETQKVEKCVMDQDGTSVVCLIGEIESVEIPAEVANATEATMEDVMGNMLAVIFMGANSGVE